jgi:TetR/AcrR family tetracycline transcriptional repressor
LSASAWKKTPPLRTGAAGIIVGDEGVEYVANGDTRSHSAVVQARSHGDPASFGTSPARYGVLYQPHLMALRVGILTTSGKSSGVGMALEKAAIVDAGLALLKAEGFDALSLRKIADALGVQTPALYWHVKNRAELYGLMAEHMLHEAIDHVDETLDGRAWLAAFGRSIHHVHMRRRDAARLVSSVMPTQVMERELLRHIVDRLVAGGMSRGDAVVAHSAVLSLTLGWSLFESNAQVAALMRESMDLEASFHASLDALIDGLFARAGQAG